MTARTSDTLLELLDAFDAAWQKQPTPPLEPYLPPEGHPERRAALVGLVHIDLERRIRAGNPTRVEGYLERYPELGANENDLLDLVLQEHRLCRRHGLPAAPDDLPARFPTLADRLRLHLLETSPPAPAPPEERAGLDRRGYPLLELLGRGGMGEVYRSRDPGLSRDLALKVIRPRPGDTALEARFAREARITGSLEHPGIVPVHNLGRLPDGRLCFTMKLVRGRTFAEILAAGPRSPAEHLDIFEKVCQAVAYAHSRGIIHRDLKPANVMVGAFGEVQVMDWGLARGMASPGDEAGEEHHPVGAAAGELTRPGEGLGTLAYAAPEQARGESVDARADVFGLGAILCEVLTGSPPFTGSSRAEVQRRAEAGDLGEAYSLLDAGSASRDAELIQLCRRCLSPRPEDRPADARSLAAEVSAYRAGVQERLRRAELERAEQSARAEEETRTRQAAEGRVRAERRARWVTIWLALAAVALLAVSWRWRERQEAAERAVRLALGEARQRQEQASQAPLGDAALLALAAMDAEKAVELARTGGASPGLRQEAEGLAEQLRAEEAAVIRDRALLAALLKDRAPGKGVSFRRDAKGALVEGVAPSTDEQFVAAFSAWGLDVERTPAEEAARRLRERPPQVVLEVLAALEHWERELAGRGDPRAERVTALADALDAPGSRRRQLRTIRRGRALLRERAIAWLGLALRPVPVPYDAGLGEGRQALRRLIARVDPASESVLGVLTLARVLLGSGEAGEAERLLRAAVRVRPAEPVLLQTLGLTLETLPAPRWPEAIECYTALRALRPELGGYLAEALVQGGRPREGLELYERLAAERPDDPGLHYHWGRALLALGHLEKAEAALRRAIALNPDFPVFYYPLGDLLDRQGKYAQAEQAFRTATRLSPKFHQAHHALALVLERQGRRAAAELALREAVRLAPRDPAPLAALGVLLSRLGRHAEGEECCRSAVRLAPDEARYHANLGLTLFTARKFPAAVEAFRTAARLAPDDPERHFDLGTALLRAGRAAHAETALREALRLRPGFLKALSNLAFVLTEQGKFAPAEEVYRSALRQEPANAALHDALGAVLSRQGKHREARAACQEAVRLAPTDPAFHTRLGEVLGDLGEFQEAVAAFYTAIRLKRDDATPYYYLGHALESLRRPGEAEEAYRQALCLRPEYHAALYNLGGLLFARGRHAEAEAAYRQVGRLAPTFAEAHCNLGHALRAQGKFADALPALRRGHALGSKSPGWPYPSAAWVKRCERLVELDRRLPAIRQGEQDAGPDELLEMAALCHLHRSLHATAARLCAEAFTRRPHLAEDLTGQPRYYAARSAALASAGQGADARRLPDRVVAALRRAALRWLRADLAAYTALCRDPIHRPAVRHRLDGWLADPALAGVRDAGGLERLDPDEQDAWRQLWREVEALRKATTP
jgi:serine/threonine-protein kinase